MAKLWKYREIIDEGDTENRFEIIEDNGDRVVIRSTVFCVDFLIRPIKTVLKSEIVEA